MQPYMDNPYVLFCLLVILFHFSIVYLPFYSFFLILCREQVLSVAVYNHYKRIYLQSVKKWSVLFLSSKCCSIVVFLFHMHNWKRKPIDHMSGTNCPFKNAMAFDLLTSN